MTIRPFLGSAPPIMFSTVARFEDSGLDPTYGTFGVVQLDSGAEWEPNCHVAVDVDANAFLDLLVERISSLG